MKYTHLIVHSILLFTVPSIALYPEPIQNFQTCNSDTPSYDEILQLIEAFENGELENRCTSADLENLNHFFASLAQHGILPGQTEEQALLDNDIQELLGQTPNQELDYTIVPALLQGRPHIFLCKNWFSKKREQGKKFVKKHKKEILIGVAVVVAAVAVVGVIAAVSAAGAAAAAAAEPDHPTPKTTVEDQIALCKETIGTDNLLQSSPQTSLEESGRTLGSLVAHEQLNLQLSDTSSYPNLLGHSQIDQHFSTQYAPLYINPSSEVDFTTRSYQVRGEQALAQGYYAQAAEDFGKAIELDPNAPLSYLHRGTAYFQSGQYDRSIEEFRQYTSHTPAPPFSISDFTIGFAKGLPKGAYESGEGLSLFFSDCVTHPVRTAGQMADAVTTLASLVHNDEWGLVGQSLSPQVHQLVTEWETLPSEKKGELAGYALGKHGTDILLPGALAKVAAKSLKTAQELSLVCKNLHIAQETLLLETAAEIGNGAKVAEVIEASQKTAFLAEELGLSATELGQLKQAGTLETTITNNFTHLTP